jgi:8-oxo-dGTP pyrophosphatase MutT (NUDIX family)
MEKFSMFSQKFNAATDEDYVWQGDYLKIKNIEGWDVVVENDCVLILPYLIDTDEIILRKEVIPPFKFKTGQDFFLTGISGTIENNESVEETLFRELQEEAGIKLNTGYKQFKKWSETFFNKGNTAKCHIYYVPLYNYDYITVMAKGDGSEEEAKSTAVRVNIKYLNNLKPSDLATTLALEFFKNEIK